ncbi:hypothetical protein PLESTB_000364100 [Pleodorina starrii]|uniref:Molybdopterin synthase catalytic subunit n=1 Tax=Pleodorina starrii TaxID=330485 RepID=A0A9W6BEF7_9CHLO|nr:hypothetical protein PLESTM_000031100 [Pleodorina starrii]GLC50300.1 hypothetical protein PLESTB_000364100 [Pleodorina starrii]GLC64316.1 hypothetical protein PLESTF_000148500 [Pleodorina starrii]
MSAADENIFVEIKDVALDINQYMDVVADPGAGAIATFSGVTRNTFQGKAVIKLEYEAYVPMALKKLQELAHELALRWTVCKIAIAHRTGTVCVGEPSVIIAVSSAHRRECLEAVHWAIDELKATVPIWKKEFFEDGSTWKENEESRRLLQAPGGGRAPAGDASPAAGHLPA